MDDPNITMEEYIRLEKEKLVGVVRSIVFKDALTSEVTLSCEPTVSPLNDHKIDFRTSFDESDEEDYTPEVSYFDDLDFFKDFENEFPAIVYNDALTSKLDFLIEPNLSPQHIDKFNLKDETSLSECDEEEQNVLYFNDLFHFNVIYSDDLKSDTDNANDEIDIEQPLGDMSAIPLPNGNDDSEATSMDETNNTHPEGIVPNETDFINDFYENLKFNSDTEELPVNTLKRSSRQTKLPSSLNDFIVEGKVKYKVERVVNYANLNHDNYCFVSALNKSVEPTCYEDAILYSN
ncbi:hypothetical protein Tco_0228042 [Tanacetum coccineum]